MISIKNLHKSFKKNHVLKGIDVEIKGQGIIALLGPNGSGKTTMLKCFLGMVIPDSGEILFQGNNIIGQYAYRQSVGYLPQIARFPDNLTGRELIELMKSIKCGETREEALIDLFDLSSELDKKMSNLSGGNRQKVNITLALMHDSPLIILDEPSAGLDPLSIKKFKDFLRLEKERGKTIIVTTHIMSLAEDLADDILFLLDGQVYFQGSLARLLELQMEESLENAIAQILDSKKKSPSHERYIEV